MTSPHISILASDLSGFMAAAYLSRRFPNFQYSLIDLRKSEIVEAAPLYAIAPPDIRKFNRYIGLKESDFIRATGASIYLGDRYTGFSRKPYVVPFGDWGTSMNGVGFFDLQQARGQFESLADQTHFSFPASMIATNRFLPPDAKGRPILSDFDYGYQFDPSAYADVLLKGSPTVKQIQVRDLSWDGETLISDNNKIDADLFLDGSGTQNNIFGQSKYDQDWSSYGFPSRFAADGQPRKEEDSLPLCVDFQAEREIIARINTQHLKLHIKMGANGSTPCGRRDEAWSGNVLHLGLAQSRQTPLQGLPLRSVIQDLYRLADLMPLKFKNSPEAKEYNRLSAEVYDRMRDVQALLFHTSSLTEDIPSTVQDKLRLFRARGKLMTLDHDSLFQDQWPLYMYGQDIKPARIDPLAKLVPTEEINATLGPIQDLILKVLSTMPTHGEFITRTCAAPGFIPPKKVASA